MLLHEHELIVPFYSKHILSIDCYAFVRNSRMLTKINVSCSWQFPQLQFRIYVRSNTTITVMIDSYKTIVKVGLM